MRVHIIRHGQTNWNAIRRVQGQSESVLTELGKKQATALGEDIKQHEVTDVYCSSSVRTRETCDALFPELKTNTSYLDNLREIYLGPWEGRMYDEIEQDTPEDYQHFWSQPHLFAVEGAETFSELQVRALATLQTICRTTTQQNIAIVSHGALIKTILCHFEDKPLSSLWEPPRMHNCAHSILDLDDQAQGEIIQYAGVEKVFS
jgi:broad specificity phosphatase PhoE